MTNQKSSFFIAAIMLCASILFCSNVLGDTIGDRIDGFLNEIMESYSVPGMAVAVIKNGEVIFSKGYGFSNLEAQIPVTASTLFSTASVTKVFVGTAIMQLVEQGKIKLDNPVTGYLSYFKMDDERYKKITIRQLLNHTSGMPDIIDIKEYGWEHPDYDDSALERYVRSISGKKLIADPGAAYNYSSMAYDVLGDVVAKVSGEVFEDYIKAHILQPLDMTKSTLLLKEVDKNLLATPYQLTKNLTYTPNDVFPYNRMHPASGTLFSSVEDLGKWAMANLNRGEFNGKRILEKKSYEVMWSSADPENVPIGISWMIEPFDEYTLVSHDGGDPGYRTELRMIPELSLAVVIVRNCWEPPLDDLASFIVRMAMGKEVDTRVVLTMAKIWKSLREKGTEAAVAYYKKLHAELSEDYFHPYQLNRIGMYLTWQDRYEDAAKLYKLNVEMYPKIFQLYDILANCYVEMGKTSEGILWYERSLAVNPANERTKEILRKLKATQDEPE